MLTLTLCQSEHGFYCIQVTDEAGDLVDLYYLSGETCSVSSHTWEALAEVGEQDAEDPDSDDFWHAVDTSIGWLAEHKGCEAGWQACNEAYEGILSDSERVRHFEECTV